MNKSVITLLTATLISISPVFADSLYMSQSELLGDSFFTPPALQQNNNDEEAQQSKTNSTLPPIKKLRLKIKYNRALKHSNETYYEFFMISKEFHINLYINILLQKRKMSN